MQNRTTLHHNLQRRVYGNLPPGMLMKRARGVFKILVSDFVLMERWRHFKLTFYRSIDLSAVCSQGYFYCPWALPNLRKKNIDKIIIENHLHGFSFASHRKLFFFFFVYHSVQKLSCVFTDISYKSDGKSFLRIDFRVKYC